MEKCCSKVLWRSVVVKSCRDLLEETVGEECFSFFFHAPFSEVKGPRKPRHSLVERSLQGDLRLFQPSPLLNYAPSRASNKTSLHKSDATPGVVSPNGYTVYPSTTEGCESKIRPMQFGEIKRFEAENPKRRKSKKTCSQKSTNGVKDSSNQSASSKS